MSLNWSLKELYQLFGSNEFKNDMNNLTEEITSINEWIDEATKDYDNVIVKLEEYLKKSIKLNELISKLGVFIELSISVNTKDSEALKNSDIFEKKLTYLVEGSTKIERYISGLIEKSELLKEHKFLLNSIAQDSKYLLSEKEENIIANMKNTGSNAWSKLKDNLISSLTVEISEHGKVKEYPLTVVLNMIKVKKLEKKLMKQK